MQKTGKVDKRAEGGGGGNMTMSMRTENQDPSRGQGRAAAKGNLQISAFEPGPAVACPA